VCMVLSDGFSLTRATRRISNNVEPCQVFFWTYHSLHAKERVTSNERNLPASDQRLACNLIGRTQSDPNISPIVKSTMITTSNSPNRERDAQSV
jgi:hypothetical protein